MPRLNFGRDADGRIAALVDGIPGLPGGSVIVTLSLDEADRLANELLDLQIDEPANNAAYGGGE